MAKPLRRIVRGNQVTDTMYHHAKQLRHAMTIEETLLWQHLRANRLQGLHFRRQQIIEGYIVDFYCHTAGVVVEVDGEIHQKSIDYDRARDAILSAYGLRILRFGNTAIKQNLPEVLACIMEACKTELEKPIL